MAGGDLVLQPRHQRGQLLHQALHASAAG
jgi:hypothetical protein